MRALAEFKSLAVKSVIPHAFLSESDTSLTSSESFAQCEVCFAPSTPVEVTLDPHTETFEVSGGSIDLDLADVTVIIEAAGLELVLSNIGDDPACVWEDSPPSVTLESPVP